MGSGYGLNEVVGVQDGKAPRSETDGEINGGFLPEIQTVYSSGGVMRDAADSDHIFIQGCFFQGKHRLGLDTIFFSS